MGCEIMSPRYVDQIADIVLQHCDIISIISRYTPLKKAGRNYKALCPLHGEKTPSFVVSEEKQLFHCFGCGAGGSAIQFMMQMEKLEFIEAVEALAEQCGLDLSPYEVRQSNPEAGKELQKLQTIVREAAVYYLKLLQQTPNAGYDYLTGRGLSETLIKEFGLGLAPDGWDHLIRHLNAKGFDNKTLEKAGLVISRENRTGYYDRFRNRVMFPIQDGRGKVIGFGGRVLDDSVPKYLNSPESVLFDKGKTLYGFHIARKHIGDAGILILVEGYMDVVSLHQYGIRNVTATLGTAMTSHHGAIVKRAAKEIILAYDSDSAGVKATLRGLEILDAAGVRARVLELGDFKDPDEYIRANGPESFLAQIHQALPGTAFILKQIARSYNLESGYDQLKYLDEAVAVLRKVRNAVERETYIIQLSEQTKKSPESIYGLLSDQQGSDLGIALKELQSIRRDVAPENLKVPEITPMESKLLEAAVLGKDAYLKLEALIHEEWFISPPALELWKALRSYYQSHDRFVFEAFIDTVDLTELSVLAESLKKTVPLDNQEREFRTMADRLHGQFLKTVISGLEERVKVENKTLEKSEQDTIIKRLYAYKKELSDLLSGKSRQDTRGKEGSH